MTFQLVCIECNSIGVVIDHGELAPPSAIVKCSHCSAARGTLGELRSLASSGRRDFLDVGLGIGSTEASVKPLAV